jgi:hypothetical protein
MDAIDLNFTTSIVGSPVSVVLGKRRTPREMSAQGLRMNLRDGSHAMQGSWLEWWLLRSGDEWVGLARKRPGRVRLWLERHGLLLAGIAIALFLVEAAAVAALLPLLLA